MTRHLRIGTRASALALNQTARVQARLAQHFPDATFEIVHVSVEGDTDKTTPLTVIGGRGVFTSAIQRALLDGDIDVAVHSAKDLPGISVPGLTLAAFPEREDPRDALISRHGVSLEHLPRNPVIGTSSRRRAVQILQLRPDAEIVPVRGNIDTRLSKALTEQYDAVILAVAGISRMGWDDRITQVLPIGQFTSAPSQGAIAVETRTGAIAETVSAISDDDIAHAVRLERLFLRATGGGCTTPIGAYAEQVEDRWVLHAMLGDESLNTLVRVREELEASPEDQIAELAQRMQRETRRPKPDRPRIPVLVTGSASHIERVARELDGTAIEAVAMETIRIEPVSEAKPEPLPDVDWVVITSPNAVPFVESYVKEAVTSGAQVAVVGSSTADALNQAGVQPNLVGDRDGEHLAQLLVKQGVMGSTVVCLVSNIARPELPSTLESAGAKVITKVVYRTEPVSEIDDRVRARIESGEFAAVMFASPSSVESVVRLLGSSLPALSGASLLAIGETTANQMRAFDLPVHGVAEQPNPGAFADLVLATFGSKWKSQA